jgi:hypothetical protein
MLIVDTIAKLLFLNYGAILCQYRPRPQLLLIFREVPPIIILSHQFTIITYLS